MQLKKEPAYRKAVKKDFPFIQEFIRKNYHDRWEFEEPHTEKHLTKIMFYDYMIHRNQITVATYRDQTVGALITGKQKAGHPAPACRLKKVYHFLRLKLSGEGRKNLEHFSQIRKMQQKLTADSENQILFLYVSKDYRRNGIGSGLLAQLSQNERNTYSIYMDQMDHRSFMEAHGFIKRNETSQMRELNKKRFRETIFLYQAN